jgi:hypothetical protein
MTTLYETGKRYESMKALLKMHKCPEILAGANFFYRNGVTLHIEQQLCAMHIT